MSETKMRADVVKTDVGELLKQLGGGRVAFKLVNDLEAVVRAVCETAKAGKVVLAIEVAPLKGSTEQLALTGTVTMKLPEKTDISVFFPLSDGGLSRRNPNQMEFGDKEESFQQ